MTSSFAAALKAAPSRQRGQRCSVAVAVDQLSPDDRADFMAAMLDDSVEGSKIAAALTAMGLSVKAHSLRRHRKAECSCDVR